jgi:putative chitinase
MDKYDDDDDITKETKLVNGGFNGLDDRKKYFERAKKALVK